MNSEGCTLSVLSVLKRRQVIRDAIVAVVFLIVGIIASPAFEDWWDANVSLTPVKLSNFLQNNRIEEFENQRKQLLFRTKISKG